MSFKSDKKDKFKNFIVFEGMDCSGKSTTLFKISSLINKNNDVLFTREPGSLLPFPDSYKIEEIRTDILNHPEYSDLEQAILFAKARKLHTEQIISLLPKYNIVSDRYILSSIIYQGLSLGEDKVKEINEDTIKLLKDNNICVHSIVFDISEETYYERLKLRNASLDALEDVDKEVVKKRIEKFNKLKAGRTDIGYVHKIDANKDIEKTYSSAYSIIMSIMNNEYKTS